MYHVVGICGGSFEPNALNTEERRPLPSQGQLLPGAFGRHRFFPLGVSFFFLTGKRLDSGIPPLSFFFFLLCLYRRRIVKTRLLSQGLSFVRMVLVTRLSPLFPFLGIARSGHFPPKLFFLFPQECCSFVLHTRDRFPLRFLHAPPQSGFFFFLIRGLKTILAFFFPFFYASPFLLEFRLISGLFSFFRALFPRSSHRDIRAGDNDGSFFFRSLRFLLLPEEK